MMNTSILFFIGLFSVVASEAFSRGLGENIKWVTLEKGLEIAKEERRPVMMIIHKTWCGACKAFKPKFAASKEIEELSQHLAMVNLEDDEEPSVPAYAPDGGYIPRILFLDPKGVVMQEVYNEDGSPQYKYYYPEVDAVVKSMKKAFKTIQENKAGFDEL